MQSSINKRSPLKYFLLVFGLSAPLWILQTQIKKSGLPLDIPITDIIAAFMPLTVACILVGSEKGGQAVWDLLKRIFDFRRITCKRWYLVVCLLPLLMFIVIYATLHVAGVPLPDGWQISLLSIPLLLVFFFFGAAGEEVGYMGYAFEPMQKRWGALGAALVIGVPWAVWHYPSILEQGHNFIWILWGTLGTVAIRVLIVWIYNNTNASLFACIMFHAMYNTGRPLFPHSASLNPLVDYPAIHYSVLAVTALIVALLWDSRTMTKFRPGIQREPGKTQFID
jgi:membrane protease YdiL (CAAX protease family)